MVKCCLFVQGIYQSQMEVFLLTDISVRNIGESMGLENILLKKISQ